MAKKRSCEKRGGTLIQGTCKVQRWCVEYSSHFDLHPYDIKLIKDVLKDAGAKNIRVARWKCLPNQPRVVTFEGLDGYTATNVVSRAVNTPWIIVSTYKNCPGDKKNIND